MVFGNQTALIFYWNHVFGGLNANNFHVLFQYTDVIISEVSLDPSETKRTYKIWKQQPQFYKKVSMTR